MKRVSTLTCGCCGERARGRQHWNHDTGFGLCAKCVYHFLEGGERLTDELAGYGKMGHNFAMPIAPDNVGKIPPGTLVCSRKVNGEIVTGTLKEWDNGTAIITTEDGRERAA